MSTISGTVNHGITLGTSGAYASPLIVTPAGAVSNNGTGDAIYGPAGYAGTWAVYNQGQVSATGGFYGIDLRSPGSVVNTGSIGGGVTLAAGGAITNKPGAGGATAATINANGQRYALNISGGTGTIANYGTIKGGGIYLSAGGSLINTGEISGGGVTLAGGTVSNSGVILAAINLQGPGSVYNESNNSWISGINLAAGGRVTNGSLVTSRPGSLNFNSPRINGPIQALGTTGATVTNFGAIRAPGNAVYINNAYGRGFYGIAVSFANPSSVLTLEPGSVIMGKASGAGGTLNLAPGGYSSAGGYRPGGYLYGLGTRYADFTNIAVLPGGHWHLRGTTAITGTLTNNGVLIDGDTLLNSGTIQTAGTAAAALYQLGGDIFNSGLIRGAKYAISGGNVVNYGTIAADSGIAVAGFLSLRNKAGGMISGGNGIAVRVPSYLVNAGTIQATNATAVYAAGGNVDNQAGGSIQSGTGNAIYGATGRITNAGLIANTSTGSAAVSFLKGTGVISNSGSINSGNTGIYLAAGGSVTNGSGGMIRGGYAGLALAGAASANISNKGGITGGSGVVIDPADTAANTIVNYGTIAGSGGTALTLGGGNDLLLIEPGSLLSGAIANFHTGATIDLVGIVANSQTYSNHGLTLRNDATTVATLPLPGNFTAASFALAPDGRLGTDIVIAGPALGADFLVQNQNTGEIDIGYRTSNGFTQLIPIGSLGAQWQFVGTGDYLADGRDQFLIYDQTTGDFQVGEATDSGNSHFVDGGIIGAQLHFEGSGNFLADGRDGFLLYNPSTGELDIEEINAGFTQTTRAGIVGAGLQFDGTGDFLGDGRAQFLLYDPSSGKLMIEETSGGFTHTTEAGILGAQWQFVGTGDYLGDGHAQFLIENQGTGEIDIGEKTGTGTQFTQIGTLGAQWQFESSADFLGHGRAQFLIHNQSTGELDIGERTSNGFTQFTPIGSLGAQFRFAGTGHFLGGSGTLGSAT